MSKINFYTGLTLGVMLFSFFSIYQVKEGQALPVNQSECFIAQDTADQIKQLGPLNSENLDHYLAWMLVADFETQ